MHTYVCTSLDVSACIFWALTKGINQVDPEMMERGVYGLGGFLTLARGIAWVEVFLTYYGSVYRLLRVVVHFVRVYLYVYTHVCIDRYYFV